jgi:transaldolase
MKFFLDTANIDEIKTAVGWGMLDGVTTNPTLVAKEGRKFKEAVIEICSVVDGPVSAEAVEEDYEGMLAEARDLAGWAPNIVVKIPMTRDGMRVVKSCAAEGIKTNVTLVFSVNQALLAAKAGATYVSVFVGRIDDTGHDGMQVVCQTQEMLDGYGFESELIAASIRHPLHVAQCMEANVDVCTIPFKVAQAMFMHPLTDVGIRRFLDDFAKIPK